jgi:hypothetical protein|tara:strand:+ start:843 stop:1166 length:324 start_codon:yes stop_codon:yes gene_type:complete
MIRLKTLIEQNQPPQDKVIDIKGSLPYVNVIYDYDGNTVNIDFDDYELEDQLDNYTWHGDLIGTDQNGEEWIVDATAVVMGGGDYEWDVDWDTMSPQGKPTPNVKKQ